ncbi:MAG: ATP-dependent Clp protease ATP-binding subunit ClpE [Parcubacteria group bacterium ADurb.Bin247]|jgi:ATP-dependent Clp protease ATP-binding subunit ClpC|nr:MAG: ATP-dependent Clp protease ATP-binding subunit ClpE [Parcubacteria group bacterium ADurb.Bin247]HQB85167.1 ATP-dependent Clp protease ATP-binding subunit [Candidatus Pacearchaeota archaeon]
MVIKEKFNTSSALIFNAVTMNRFIIFRKARLFKTIFFLLFVISLFYFLIIDDSFVGLIFLFFSFFLIFFQIEYFFNLKLKYPKIKDSENIAELFNFDVARSFSTDTCKFLYNLLDDSDFTFVFSRLGIDIKEVRTLLKTTKDNDDIWTLLLGSLKESKARGGVRIKKNDVLIFASENHFILKEVFKAYDVSSDDVRNVFSWIYNMRKKEENKKKFWKWENLIKKGSLAKDWASGYTIMLDKFSINWTDYFKRNGFPDIIGHKKQIEETERVLAKSNINNVLLVGDPGVGRVCIIRALAKKMFYGTSLANLNYKRVIELDIPFLIANVDNNEELENILDHIFREVVNSGNTVLFINDIHNFLLGESKPGKVDISGVLANYLPLASFPIIGITDYTGYRNINNNSSVGSFFEKIDVFELSPADTIIFLQRQSINMEFKYRKIISYQAIKEIVACSERYIPEEPFPKKALDLLDEAMMYISQTNEKTLLPEHIRKIVSRKMNIPIGVMDTQEKDILMNLESLIHKRLINQESAVKEISSALRRSRSDISSYDKPIGSFLFIGPTGVGKTETAKALAEVYFKNVRNMIRIDMSEFQTLGDIERLIGSSSREGILTSQVKQKPFSLVLLDELEKAHSDVLNVFLQILDEGSVTDGLGQKVDFKNCIIIATSNAGSNLILEKDNMSGESLKLELLNYFFKESIFKPEFINRFSSVILFEPLSKEHLLDIAQLILNRIKNNLEEKGIEFEITEELKKEIVNIGYNPVFGAREIKRVIQDKVENTLADGLISGTIKKGSTVKIVGSNFELVLTN